MSDDRGTVLPLVVLSFLLSGLMVTAGTAASAAFLAQRDLAGVCDGAALAGAAALDRAALDRAALDRAGLNRAASAAGADGADSAASSADAGSGAVAGLPVSAAKAAAAVEEYGRRAARPGLRLAPSTDGVTVTVTCRRTVRIPFGAMLKAADGLERTAVARARTELTPGP